MNLCLARCYSYSKSKNYGEIRIQVDFNDEMRKRFFMIIRRHIKMKIRLCYWLNMYLQSPTLDTYVVNKWIPSVFD